MEKPVFTEGQKILFIGDSITDCGRNSFPSAPYGDGYVSMVRNYLTAVYPGLYLEFVNRGVGGDTIRDLAYRWDRDVLEEKPDWLSVKVGINDVWAFITSMTSYGVGVEEYEETYRRLLAETREKIELSGLILMDPYVIEADPEDPFRKTMKPYLEVVGRLAREFGAIHVESQKAFDQVLEHRPAPFWADDRVHPDGPGHAVLALAFLRATGALG